MDDCVTIQYDTFTANICLNALIRLPISNIRRLFKMALSEAWSNEASILAITEYLKSAVQNSKESWAETSRRYQNEWRLIDKPNRRRTKVEVKKAAEIRAHNKELIRELKKSKAQYEKIVRLQTIWLNMKHELTNF